MSMPPRYTKKEDSAEIDLDVGASCKWKPKWSCNFRSERQEVVTITDRLLVCTICMLNQLSFDIYKLRK